MCKIHSPETIMSKTVVPYIIYFLNEISSPKYDIDKDFVFLRKTFLT